MTKNHAPTMSRSDLSEIDGILPFAFKSGAVVIGRNSLSRARKKLLFLLITTDISDNSRNEILNQFSELPVVELYHSTELADRFGLHNCKVLGFKNSGITQRICRVCRTLDLIVPSRERTETAPPASENPGRGNPSGEGCTGQNVVL